jgi:arginyl-tRNA synthetase
MSDEALQKSIERALREGRDYGSNTSLAGKRTNLEFVSADPTGPLDLQHGRIAATGDALCRLLEACGASVTREYFLNDSEGSSKLRLLGESVSALYLENFGHSSSAPEGIVRDAFTRGVARELGERRGNELLLVPDAERIAVCTHEAREAAVTQHRQTLKRFGTHFDVWTSESALRRDRLVDSMIDKLRAAGHAYEKNGVLWLKSTAFGDEADRPLVRGGSDYTYLAADIAYHAYRFERDFELLINIWTAQHQQYVARTQAALRAAGFETQRLEVLLCGDAVALRDGEPWQIEEREPSLSEALEEFDADNLRLLLLLGEYSEPVRIEREVALRDDESNPAYALRLLPSRLNTLLRQSQAQPETQNPVSGTESHLARLVALWPDEVETAARERRPQRIARFLLEMGEATRSLLSSTRPESNLSTDVLRAASVVTENGLRMLGVEPRTNF